MAHSELLTAFVGTSLAVPIGSSIQEVYKAPNRNSNSNSNIPQIKYCRQRQHLQRRIFDEAKGGNFLRFDRLLTEAQTIITAQEGEDAGKEAVNFPYRCFDTELIFRHSDVF